MIVMMVILFAVMYFLMIRPQKKRQKEEQEMRNSLEIGDEIITIGGIVGKVVTIREEDLVIETGADRNRMTIQRWAVNTNKTKMEQHRKEVEAADAKDLRAQMDLIKSQNQDAIIALAAVTDGKVSLVVTVPKDLTSKVRAGDIMKGMAGIVDGKGGGRPDMAQGGGPDGDKADAAIAAVKAALAG